MVIVVVLLVLAFVVGGIILGNQRFTPPWASRYVVNAAFEATPGVSPGNGQEVRVAGIVVGQIAAAQVNPDGKAELSLSMEPGTQIYDNASLVLRPKSPLNEMYVEIAPGGPPGAPVASGGSLPVANTKRPIQVDEVLAHLDGESRRGLTQLLAESDVALASAPAELPGGLDATASVTESLAPVVTELDARRDTLRRLVGALGDISEAVGSNDTRLTGLVDSLRTTLSALSENNAPLDRSLAQLPDLSDQLRNATSEVQGLADQLDPTLRNVQAAAGDLPEALSRLEDTAGQLDSTIDVASPVVREARPVVADLRPYAGDLNAALPPLQRITTDLDPLTGSLTDYLPDIGAFFVNTREIVSLRDANSGILRGILTANPETLLPPPANLPGTAGPITDDGQNPVELPLPGTEPGGGTNPAPEAPADAPAEDGPAGLPLVAPR
ncbi:MULTISPECIES: MlaD family protein [unclassified Pseudonocardia]|uniref:MlaD family protein n=1 Tax=unclassified Pseudonocardia TaxID=2619320 RepID=UPI0001FFEA15|nr:MlaD family protein [Pseudonocardia sp. Ae707_Ps1]